MKGILSKKGFTLIEVMVVIVILGILAGWIAPKLLGRTDDARRVKAEMDIASFETALRLYRLDMGRYPTTEEGLESLVRAPDSGGARWREGGYLESRRIPLDPWGNAYIYLSPGIHGEYDIFSYGADGVAGGEGPNADITSWDED
ncbi:type II secretion system major pseudopilin GspG [Desulfobotulus sp. H1]|uniref:Type II secretion system core protein G n=1 Tax=Desulfobotulus pelophilus TaxID=2823377 RepID=A0ABT3N665_9BACT|nr:type II secretion system major pseudopilin GspG [Desulfobotulus pelophilus]MCW7752952.1 type II secretion system major pseudopilin GspG [Desulfobotulus pelophilus]